MKEKYKYDVAISYAVEDTEVAYQITKSLRLLGKSITYYEFSEDERWGQNLLKTTLDVYSELSEFVIVIVSENYIKKHWSSFELQVIQMVLERNGQAYLLPVRLDDTVLPGVSDNIIFKLWENNPDQIALSLCKVIINNLKTTGGKQKLPVDILKGMSQDGLVPNSTQGAQITNNVGSIRDQVISGRDTIYRRIKEEEG